MIRTSEKGNYSKAENEEACAKIWSIYVGEAERYDKALIESWKADMEGMLIFVSPFSSISSHISDETPVWSLLGQFDSIPH
jgi:hypothetical protein